MFQNKNALSDNKFTLAPILIFSLTVLFSSVCMMINITMRFSLFMALAAVIITGFIYSRKIVLSCLITVFFLAVFIFIAGHIYDTSFDGMYFQKEAFYALSNGWNPWRISFYDYSQFGDTQDIALWLDNYPKGVWSFYACLYSFIGKVEYIKGANIIFVLMVFFAACDTLRTVFKKKGVLLFLLSAVFAANTVIVSQFFTYMNDLPVAALVIVCALIGMKIYADKADNIDYICLAAVFAASFAVKFNAPIFCGLTLLAYGVATIIKNKGKRVLKPCLIVIFSAVIGFSVFGADPYIKHMTQGHHPLHPVMGSEKYDIMNSNAPEGLEDMSSVGALMTSLFSEAAPNPGDKPVLKIPFSTSRAEIIDSITPDTRLSGFGVWFGGILILSLLLGIYPLFKYKKNRAILPALIIFTVLAMFFPEGWWARYHPYIYYIPVLLILALSNAEKTKLVSILICAVVLINSVISGASVIYKFNRLTREIDNKLNDIKATGLHTYLRINDFPCHEIWFAEHGIDYEMVWTRDDSFETFYGSTYYKTVAFEN